MNIRRIILIVLLLSPMETSCTKDEQSKAHSTKTNPIKIGVLANDGSATVDFDTQEGLAVLLGCDSPLSHCKKIESIENTSATTLSLKLATNEHISIVVATNEFDLVADVESQNFDGAYGITNWKLATQLTKAKPWLKIQKTDSSIVFYIQTNMQIEKAATEFSKASMQVFLGQSSAKIISSQEILSPIDTKAGFETSIILGRAATEIARVLKQIPSIKNVPASLIVETDEDFLNRRQIIGSFKNQYIRISTERPEVNKGMLTLEISIDKGMILNNRLRKLQN